MKRKPAKRWIGPDECAARLGVSRTTFYRWAKLADVLPMCRAYPRIYDWERVKDLPKLKGRR